MTDTANTTKAEPPSAGASKPTPRRPARAELVWEAKYEADGKRVAPLRVTLPFQTIEAVNESAEDRRHTLELFAQNRQTEWRNRLIWGDKKYLLPSLLADLAGKVNLIYIDPPFDTGADFSFTATVPDHPDTPDDDSFNFTKEPSIIEQKAYRDTWGRGLDSYLQWFYETAVLLHELLHESGSLYVHLDYHVSHYCKAILDEVFGPPCLVNEIVWKRTYAHNDPGRYGITFDSLYFYEKTNGTHTWNQPYQPYDESYIKSHFNKLDERGRRYQLVTLDAPAHGRPPNYIWKGIAPPSGRMWTLTREKMEELERQDRIEYTRNDIPRRKYFLDELPGVPVQALWIDIPPVNSQAIEAVNYPTQKPEALLERIIKASSNEGDLVLDCFCGSGTTAAVAEKFKRRWIACDLSRFAIHTTRKRLLSVPSVRPFVVQNLGKYERQLWQTEIFRNQNPDASQIPETAARQRAYVCFILELYHADRLHGYNWLHGVKAGRMVHVGAVDSPVSVGDVTQIAAEFKRAIGTGKDAPTTNGVDVLAWDFAFELNEIARQQAAAANIQMRFLRIPRDVMDKRAVERGEIHFFELAALAVEVKLEKRDVTLRLTNFVIPPDDVPEDVRRTVKHWSQWIDYWAVDWDNKGDTFHNVWQTYRTRKEPKLDLETNHTYDASGEYTVVVKVIDILGNDTTKTVKVKVK